MCATVISSAFGCCFFTFPCMSVDVQGAHKPVVMLLVLCVYISLYGGGWCSGNALQFYSEGTWIESRLEN
jgi:hypothetical protein